MLVSLATRPPDEEQIRGLTFQTAEEAVPTSESERLLVDPQWRKQDQILSGIVLILVAIVMLYFSNLFFH